MCTWSLKSDHFRFHCTPSVAFPIDKKKYIIHYLYNGPIMYIPIATCVTNYISNAKKKHVCKKIYIGKRSSSDLLDRMIFFPI
jgi:hypothetical protein